MKRIYLILALCSISFSSYLIGQSSILESFGQPSSPQELGQEIQDDIAQAKVLESATIERSSYKGMDPASLIPEFPASYISKQDLFPTIELPKGTASEFAQAPEDTFEMNEGAGNEGEIQINFPSGFLGKALKFASSKLAKKLVVHETIAINQQVGPLAISTLDVTVAPVAKKQFSKKLAITGNVQLFNKQANLTLHKINGSVAGRTFTVNSMELLLVFADKPRVAIAPGAFLTFDKMIVTIERDKPVVAHALANLANQQVVASVIANKGSQIVGISLNRLVLSDVIASLKGSPLAGLTLDKVSLQIMRPEQVKATEAQPGTDPELQAVRAKIEGQTNFAAIPALAPIMPNAEVEVSAVIIGTKGFELNTAVKNVVVPMVGTIPNTQVRLQSPFGRTAGSINFNLYMMADATVRLPAIAQPVSLQLHGSFESLPLNDDPTKRQMMYIFAGSLQNFTYKQFQLINPIAVINSQKASLEILGSTQIFGTTAHIYLKRAGKKEEGGEYVVGLELPKLELAKLVRPLQSTPLSKLMISDVRMEIISATGAPGSDDINSMQFELEGKANFSALNIPALNKVFPNTLLNVKAGTVQKKEQGGQPISKLFMLTAGLKNISFGGVVTMPEGIIDLAVASSEPNSQVKFSILGNMVFTIPGLSSKLNVLGSVNLVNVKQNGTQVWDVIVAGKVNTPFTYNSMKITDAEILYRPSTEEISIIGNGVIAGVTSKVTLTKIGSSALSASSELAKEIKPLKNVKGFEKADITILGGSLSVQATGQGTTVGATTRVRVYGQEFDGQVLVGSDQNVVVAVRMPKGWKFSDTFKDIPAVFDGFTLSNVELIIASKGGYIDPATKVEIPQGVSISADFEDFVILDNNRTPKGSIKNIFKGSLSAKVAGTIAPNIKESKVAMSFRAEMKEDSHMQKGAVIQGGAFTFMVTGEPEIAFEFEMATAIKKDILKFACKMGISPTDQEVELEGRMDRCWNDPLGAKGLSICDVALSVKSSLPVLLSSGLPTGMGLKGALYLGVRSPNARQFVFDTQFNGAAPEKTVLIFDFKGSPAFGLSDIIYLTNLMAAKANKKPVIVGDIPSFAINQAKLAIVPLGEAVTFHVPPSEPGAELGVIVFDQGVSVAGNVVLLDKGIMMGGHMKPEGFLAQGCIEEFKIGDLVELRGASGKMHRLSLFDKDCKGVFGEIEVDLLDQKIEFDGEVFILNGDVLHAKAILNMKKNSMMLDAEGALFSTYDAKVNLESNLSKKPEFAIDVAFHDNGKLTNMIRDAMKDGLQDMQKQYEAFAQDANSKFKAEQDRVEQQKREVDQLQGKISGCADKVRIYNQATKKKKELDDKVKACKKDPIKHAKECAEIVGKAFEAGFEEAKKGVEKAANAMKNAGCDAAQFVKDEVALKAARGTLIAYQRTLDGINAGIVQDAFSKNVWVINKGGRWIAGNVIGAVRIESLMFHGKLREIIKGIIPRLEMTLVLDVNNKVQKLKIETPVDLDAKKVGKSVKDIAKKAIDEIKKAIPKALK